MAKKQCITFDQLREMPIGQIAALSAEKLAELQEDVAKAMETAKLAKESLDGVLQHKYGDRVALLRHQKEKDFGVVRFNDGDITIAADLPKRPSWDQKKLAAVVQRIRDAGDNPEEYVETAYKVPERRFASWPSNIRRTFEPARTLKAGKPVFKLISNNEEPVQ